MICIDERSLLAFVKYTVRPSGVNDDAKTSPVEITPGANTAAVSLRVYTGGGSTGVVSRDRAQANMALHANMAATGRVVEERRREVLTLWEELVGYRTIEDE
jgi:hypothetical protein